MSPYREGDVAWIVVWSPCAGGTVPVPQRVLLSDPLGLAVKGREPFRCDPCDASGREILSRYSWSRWPREIHGCRGDALARCAAFRPDPDPDGGRP